MLTCVVLRWQWILNFLFPSMLRWQLSRLPRGQEERGAEKIGCGLLTASLLVFTILLVDGGEPRSSGRRDRGGDFERRQRDANADRDSLVGWGVAAGGNKEAMVYSAGR